MGQLQQVKGRSKAALSTLSISKNPEVADEEAPVSPISPQSPTKFHFRHRTASEYQRSHSTSGRSTHHKRTRRRSISMLPARRSASALTEPKDHLKMPPITKVQICKEVLDLFVLITDQEESPFQSSRSPSSYQAEVIDLSELFKIESWRTQEPSGMEMGPSVIPDFNCMEWRRQKLLLNRELRRLLKWDLAFRHDEDNTGNDQADCDRQATKKAEVLFSRIGQTLARLLRDDLLRDDLDLKQKVDRVRYLPKDDCSIETSIENVSQNEKYDPLEIIKTTTNHLFELLQPLKRKRSIPLGHSMPDLTSLNSRPSKIPARPRGNFEVHGRGELKHNEIMKAKYSQSRRRVHFSLGGIDTNTHAEEPLSSDKTTFTTLDENEEIPRIQGGQRVGRNIQCTTPGSKIIVKIADNPDAFQKASHDTIPTTSSSVTEMVTSQIRRIVSSEIPTDVFSNIDLEDPTLLSKRLASLSMEYTQFSPAAITNKLCDLARIEKTPLQYFESNGNTVCHDLDPELSKPLYRLESILALVMSFPDWQVFIRPGEAHHCRSAVSMIYFSLLEEIFVYAKEFLHVLQLRFEVKQKVGSVKPDLRIFCACIRQLSVLNEGVDSQFQAFQPQLQRVIEKIEILDSNIDHDIAAGRENVDLDKEAPSLGSNIPLVAGDSSCNSEINKGDFCFSFRKCYPFSLACFLSSRDDILTEVRENEVSGAFVTFKVQELFNQMV